MTILDHTGAAALQRSQLVAAFEQAGDDGLTEAVVKDLGGFHWHNRLVELRRRGYVIGETEDVFVLVVGPSVERAVDTAAPPADREQTSPLVDGSLSTEPTLFTPPSEPHYREAA